MAIIVKPMNKDFKVSYACGDEKLTFTFHQLDYQTKSEISTLVTNVIHGQVTIDATMQVYYNIKYSLKHVEGLEDEYGKAYALQFEATDKKCLTDACVNELLSIPISDELQFTARELTGFSMPDEIKHPLTGIKLEGVEVVKTAGGITKK